MAEYKFVKELPDDFQCVICAKVLNEPHLTDCCGQHFCQACLEQWFKKQEKKICPHCRSESFTHMRYLPLKRKIDDLDVYCPNQGEGCKVITKFGKLSSHKNECGFARVICTQGCGKLIFRKDLTQHCGNECSKRKIKCKYCGKIDYYAMIIGIHTTVCEYYLVNRPRGCTQPGQIKRKDLAKHAEKCPLEMVLCPFNEAGCDARVLRKDLNAHVESSTQQHLMKMMTAYRKLKIEHTKFSHIVSLTFTEPVKLTDENNTFSFSITSSQGWTSPLFCVQDGYTFCIKHKEGRTASLMLLKGKNDDNLKWPMSLQYRLKILSSVEKQHGKTAQNLISKLPPSQQVILDFDLSANLERVSVDDCSKEIANIILPMTELLNHTISTKLVATPPSLQLGCGYPAPPSLQLGYGYPDPPSLPLRYGYTEQWKCKHCNGTIPGISISELPSCPFCRRLQ